jgi:hypothetical protein
MRLWKESDVEGPLLAADAPDCERGLGSLVAVYLRHVVGLARMQLVGCRVFGTGVDVKAAVQVICHNTLRVTAEVYEIDGISEVEEEEEDGSRRDDPHARGQRSSGRGRKSACHRQCLRILPDPRDSANPKR